MALPTITTADAAAYFALTPRAATWTALTDQEIWLNEAQRWLGQLCFDETADCCGRVLADAWKEAVSELALALSKDPSALVGGAASSSGAIKSASLGGLSVTYKDEATAASRYGAQAPLVLQRFGWLGDILGCWLKVPTGSVRVLHRSCY